MKLRWVLISAAAVINYLLNTNIVIFGKFLIYFIPLASMCPLRYLQNSNQRSNCQHPLHHRKSKRILEKVYFCFICYTKTFDLVDHKNFWNFFKEMGIPDHLTCLLGNLYAGQEATDRIKYETIYWFQIGKGVCQGCIESPCLFNLYAEYIM